jgi:high-affinity iron transporter
MRRTLLGLGLLGFTSVYRERFEIVIFLQNLRVAFGSRVVLEGVLLGLLFTCGIGVMPMQLAGWIGITPIPWLHLPGWAGTWFSLFPNVETFAAQAFAVLLVLGSYVASQYVRVWRPRRRGQQVARLAAAPPASPVTGAGATPIFSLEAQPSR